MSRKSFQEFSAGLPVQRGGKKTSAPVAETTSKTPGLISNQFSGMQDRLTDVGQGVSNTIGSALQGTGEFAGMSPVGRGVAATAEGFSTVPSGALAMMPKFVRSGVEKAGEFVGNQFKKVTSAIGDTDLFQGAAGRIEVDPNTGVATYIPNDLGTLEEGLTIASRGGEITGGILGAKEVAMAPGQVSRLLTPTPKSSGSIPVQGLDEGTQIVPIRTAAEANEQVLSQYGEAPQMSPVGATISGVARQIGDFAGRTVREAQDVAATEQRLSSLPEPEAKIRRVVADERVIDLVNNLTPEEIAVTNRLVDQAKLKQGDITPNTDHPKVIAGEELLKPVQHIIDRRKSVGAQLGELRKQLGTQKNVNTNSAFRSFHTYLKDNYGVQFDKQGNIIAATGTLGKSDVPVIQDLYNELRSGTFMSQRGIDEFLQRSYKDYDLKQTREQTFSDEVSRIAERARTDMRQLMPDQYNGLATKYAEMSKPLVDMVKLLGYKGSLDELSMKDLKAGEVGMRILGNAADRPQSVINSIVDTAGEYGYNSNVNLNNIITLADQLDSLYDITPQRSFAGQVSRGVDQSGTVGALGDAATMNVGGLYNRAMSSRASQDEIREAFENYVRSLSDAQQVE